MNQDNLHHDAAIQNANNIQHQRNMARGVEEPTLGEKIETTLGIREKTIAEKMHGQIEKDRERVAETNHQHNVATGLESPTFGEKLQTSLGFREKTPAEIAHDKIRENEEKAVKAREQADAARIDALHQANIAVGKEEPTAAEILQTSLGMREPTAAEKAHENLTTARENLKNDKLGMTDVQKNTAPPVGYDLNKENAARNVGYNPRVCVMHVMLMHEYVKC